MAPRSNVKDKAGRTPMTFAEGIFLAIRPPVAKPEAIALLKQLMASEPRRRCLRNDANASRQRRRARSGRGRRCRSRPAGSSAPQPAPDGRTRRCSTSTASPVTTSGSRPAACRSRRCDLDRIGADAETWEKVVRKAAGGPDAAGGRPPARSRDARRASPRPSRRALDRAAAAHPESRARRRCTA